MTSRRSILIVSPGLPHPLNSGTNIRVHNLIAAMTSIADVHFVGYGSSKQFAQFEDENVRAQPWWSNCASARALPEPGWSASDDAAYIKLMQRKPFATEPHHFSTFPVEPLRNIISSYEPFVDLIWIERLYTAHRLGLPAHKCIVDIDDIESVKIARGADIAPQRYAAWAMRREAIRLAAIEASALDHFARLAVCSQGDAANWPNGSDRIWTIPNGTDDRLFDQPRRPRVTDRLVFVGTMNYWPNEDAVLYFVKVILPRIATRVPGVWLDIVGRTPPASIRQLHDGRQVCVYADVADVTPYVQRAMASVVPLRAGAGTRLKILESLALGTPVVSTSVGAEGLDLRDGTEILMGDSPEEFSNCVSRLLLDENQHQQFVLQGSQRAWDGYVSSQIRKRLAAALADFT